jgi:uncharacterized protein YeaO (DUF488 family)
VPVRVKSVHEAAAKDDGVRVLAEGHGTTAPTGLAFDMWVPELAPALTLSDWYAGDATRWEEFRIQYLAQLKGNPHLRRLADAAASGRLTLLTMSADLEHSPAEVLHGLLRGRNPS